MRALVTGGAGYFGELLVRKLLEQRYEVRIFDLNRPSPAIPGVEAVQGDIRDRKAVADACRGIDVVQHNVAHNPLAKDSELFWSVNRGGTQNILDACVEQGVDKVIYTSSAAVFGAPKKLPVFEDTPPSPLEVYGEAKLAGEMECREYAARGLDVTIVRPPTILGHGRLGVFQLLFEWIYRGSNIPVLDSGKNVFQFIHADDLADCCILASRRKGPEVYNCGADRYGTMREALENLCKVARSGSRVRSLPMAPMVAGMKICSAVGLSPLAPYQILLYGRSMYFDVTKAKIELGWKPRFSNEEMFVDSYRWYVENRETILKRKEGASLHQTAVKERALSLVRWLL